MSTEMASTKSATTPLAWPVTAEGSRVGEVFNSAIATAAIAALDELGLFEELADGPVSMPRFCAARGLHEMSVRALIHATACVDIVRVGAGGDIVARGPEFEEALQNKGYFLWLVRGYGGLLRELATVATESERVGDFIDRNGHYIAIAGKDYGARFVDADFAGVLEAESFEVGADLGCGSAERLISLATARPEFRGVGVEFDSKAVQHAQSRVRELGLADRVTILPGDVSRLEPQEAFDDVDVVFSFFMAHDLWPRERCIGALNTIASAFPRAERFLLCDTYRSDLPPGPGTPIFTLGFEVTHALMGQHVPSREEWLGLFEDTVWTCAGEHPVGIPFSSIFELRRPVE